MNEKEVFKEYDELKKNIVQIDTNRGSNPDRLKGYYNEFINAAENNVRRIDAGVAARQRVIDNNSVADAVIVYADERIGREIQDKVGYSINKLKDFVKDGKYDGMILEINPDHVLFDSRNEKKLEELKAIAKDHNIKIQKGWVTEGESKKLAEAMFFESNLRSKVGINRNPTITANLYADSKKVKRIKDYTVNKANEINEFIFTETEKFVSEDVAKLNRAGINRAIDAAEFAAVLSVTRSAISLVKGEKDVPQVLKDTMSDVSAAACLGYLTGVVEEAMPKPLPSGASALVAGTVQISKHIYSYINDEIDEEKFIENISETAAIVAASYLGRIVGGAFGSIAGPIGKRIGQVVGEMITTAVCSNVISEIRYSKAIEKRDNKIIALYNDATREIREAQERLDELAQRENRELIDAIKQGIESVSEGVFNGSFEQVEHGLLLIGEKFNLNIDDFKKDYISKDNLFLGEDNTIYIT